MDSQISSSPALQSGCPAQQQRPPLSGPSSSLAAPATQTSTPPPTFTSLPFPLTPIATHPTSWQPSSLNVALNATLDACIVPYSEMPYSSANTGSSSGGSSGGGSGSGSSGSRGGGGSSGGGARVDVSHVVVLDGFFGEEQQQQLLDFITEPGWDPCSPPPSSKWVRATRDRPDAA
ncbi:hypothetical protein Agub_g11688, partial [Astrephomene gubernaculifera]